MTREEAKELLIHILMAYEPKDQYGDYDDPEPYEQAITMAIEALSADTVSEDTQTEERARFVAKETELAHIEAKLENAEKRLQGACTANFVAEQLDRLRKMTDEERWDFLIKFFSPSAEIPTESTNTPTNTPTDLISRADAIGAVAKLCVDGYKAKVDGYFIPLTDALINTLSALPSAELTLQTPQTYGKSINPSNAEVVEDLISRAKLNDCVKAWYEEMGVDLHGIYNKQLAKIVKEKDEDDLALDFHSLVASINALPSADAVQRMGKNEKKESQTGEEAIKEKR